METHGFSSLGQEPNLEKLQDLVHMELTGSKFEGDPDAAERLLLLKQAMAGKNLLLVLDDLWFELPFPIFPMNYQRHTRGCHREIVN